MIETACLFGPDHALIGVLTTPDPARPAAPTAVLLYNAGVIPRYGPHRINVKLARALADQGHVVLRFDLSGVGDSPHRSGEGGFRAQAVQDIRSAMDHVTATCGVQRFILVGICSGAENGYWASQADERIVGLMMLDGFWYTTRWSPWARRLKRFRVTPWSQVLGAMWRSLLRRPVPKADKSDKASEGGIFDGDGTTSPNPPKDDFSQVMQKLVDQGVAVFLLYTDSVLDFYSYGAQMRHAFAGKAWLGQVRCELCNDIDHTMTTLASQRHYIGLVADWVSQVGARPAENRP